MINEIQSDADQRMKKSVEALGNQFAKIRTGRAHPSILHSVKVDAYGTPTALNHVASINVDDARTLSVSPFDKSLMQAIEKAILQSDLGLNPASQGDLIRVPMPQLSAERRADLVKIVKNEGEKAKIACRNIRRDIIQEIKENLKEKLIGEDEARRFEVDVQKVTDEKVAEIDKIVSAKEQDIMTV